MTDPVTMPVSMLGTTWGGVGQEELSDSLGSGLALASRKVSPKTDEGFGRSESTTYCFSEKSPKFSWLINPAKRCAGQRR